MDGARPGSSSSSHRLLAPGSDGGIAVSLWLGRDRRIAMADTAREVA